MPGRKKVEFGDDGLPIPGSEGEAPEEVVEPTEETEEVEEETEESDETETEGEEPTPAATGKYRIGDKVFATLEEAHAYATSHISTLETEQQIADAYRQGIKDAAGNPIVPESVTPPVDDINEEELYADPKAFLKKFGQKIKNETQAELDQRASIKATGDQIWNEFSGRHPDLADFRSECEQFVEQNGAAIKGIIATKGRPAGYDFIALKLKSQFERYAQAAKPKRQLPNGGGGPSPTTKGSSVTPPKVIKKPLSFAEQIRSIKKVK